MSKILFHSDIHFNLYREFSEGETGRLDRIIEVEKTIITYALDYGIKDLVFLGDWFHNRSQLNVLVLQKTLELMYQNLSNDLRFYFLVGNHDQYDSSGQVHSLYPFKMLGKVADLPCYIKIRDKLIGFIPYQVNRDQLLQDIESLLRGQKVDLLCLHQGVQEAKLPNGMAAGDESFLSLSELPDDLPIISGHIHKPQVLDNLLYIGAPLQHSFGDAGDRRGWYVLDDDGEFEFIENNFSPRFYKLEMREGKIDIPGTVDDYYWITTDGEVEEVKKQLSDFKNLRIDTFPKAVMNNSRVIEKDKTFDQMIDEYVEGTLADTEAHEVVKKYGKEVLHKVVSK